MEKHDFKEKIELYSTLEAELDDHIWSIFHRYIKDNKINFSDPEHWEATNKGIHFSGMDGCMGCYDRFGISIPMIFFEDPDKAFEGLRLERERIEKEAQRKIKEMKTIAKESRRKQYEKLKKEFENV